jgi:hypothetical protein
MGLGRHSVTAHGEFVLFGPTDAKLGRQAVGRNPHNFTRRKVGNGRCLEGNIFHFETLEHVTDRTEWTTLFHRLGHANKLLSNGPGQPNGHVRKGFHTTGDDNVGMTRHDLFRCVTDSRIGRNARLGDRVTTDRGRNAGVQGGLSRNVGRAHFLDDIAANNIVDSGRIECRLLQQSRNGLSLQIHRELVLVDGRSHGKGQPHARDDDDIFKARGSGGSAERSDGMRAPSTSRGAKDRRGGKHAECLFVFFLLVVDEECCVASRTMGCFANHGFVTLRSCQLQEGDDHGEHVFRRVVDPEKAGEYSPLARHEANQSHMAQRSHAKPATKHKCGLEIDYLNVLSRAKFTKGLVVHRKKA